MATADSGLRLNLVVTEATKARLGRLLEITDSTNLAEVVRRAIQTYEAIVEEKLDEQQKRGGKVDPLVRARNVSVTIRRADGDDVLLKVV